MADRKSLSIIGLIMSMVTVAVVLVGVFVVQGHLSGRYLLEHPVASQAGAGSGGGAMVTPNG